VTPKKMGSLAATLDDVHTGKHGIAPLQDTAPWLEFPHLAHSWLTRYRFPRNFI
jgi:hypothetical protein